MRTSRKKKKKANTNDRISDLPSNVIDGILANLKIRDLVRTSILSKKWRYMWTSAPHLCYDDDFFERFLRLRDPDTVVCKIIMDVLMLRNGPVCKFSIDESGYCGSLFSMENINMWIPFMSKDIKHLELETYCIPEDENKKMPDILFSCKELTFLKFSSFDLSVPPNFYGFKKLLELHLVMVTFASSALESLISGCPFLEKLSLEECICSNYLVITSPSLKVLVLVLYGAKSICLKEAKNLIDFTLKAYRTRSLIKSLPKIKKFSLGKLMQQYPYAGIPPNHVIPPYADIPPMLLTSSFSSLEYLKLEDFNFNDKEDILYVVSALKSAPRLIELIIKQRFSKVDTTQVFDLSKELKSLSCCLKLQTVKVYTGDCSQYAMSLIKSILANSPLLKILTFYFCSYHRLDSRMLLKISQDLLMMKRASPGAQVNFLHSAY
ncbi:F-box/FBD/LRR-repeat protein At1g13570-like isoform X1 [Vicia villosa]|uniref:F-box/FBD/LRR-repeat protein At1g13570-like isoform X1 n=1 Tax=Vicia villosa TaxID=3911 RepID=UPI00273B6AB6|nr:F-box/FBD/LRR-repeat protein At1g13570-like isoform X1 [Vicia villosa]